MIYRKRIIVFAVLILLGCDMNESGDQDFSAAYKLTETEVLKFPLDEFTSYQTSFLISFVDSLDRELLVYLNRNKPSILIYEIDTQNLVDEILLSKEGPNGVGKPHGLYVQSLDSIYVIAPSQYKISLINRNGHIRRGYRVLTGSTYNKDTGMLKAYTVCPPHKYADKLYFNIAPDRNPYSQDFFKNVFTCLSLNLSDGSFEYFNRFPSEFMTGGVWGVATITTSTAFNKKIKEFVYSFSISDSVITYNLRSKEKKRYYGGSKYIDSAIPPMEKADNMFDLTTYYPKTPFYEGIIYDQYRKVYYRIVSHPVPVSNEKKSDVYDKPISIIILDEYLNIIGETMLPKEKYVNFSYFIASKGLYISKTNPKYKDLDEDNAVFTCFKVVKNE